jgi:hypothetical protein
VRCWLALAATATLLAGRLSFVVAILVGILVRFVVLGDFLGTLGLGACCRRFFVLFNLSLTSRASKINCWIENARTHLILSVVDLLRSGCSFWSNERASQGAQQQCEQRTFPASARRESTNVASGGGSFACIAGCVRHSGRH